MQIVIDISEDLYKATINGLRAEEIWDLRLAVKNGIQLSKGHGWIPVSERQPEEGQKVLVTMDGTQKERVIITWYQDKEHGFLCGLVSAWMPLPKPYKAESEE